MELFPLVWKVYEWKMLLLSNMVECNKDTKGTTFSVLIDERIMHGISTGISAKDIAKTLQLLENSSTEP